MLDPQIVRLAAIALAALAAGGIVYVLVMPYLSGERQASKRVASVRQRQGARPGRGNVREVMSTRKRQVQDTIRDIESRQRSKARKKVDLSTRMARAGLDVPAKSFHIASGVLGLAIGAVAFLTGSSPLVSLLAGLAGALGLPRWLLSYMTKRRQQRFLKEFANAIDIVVRGVKSGLPLNDCLHVIANETPEPVCSEFRHLVEQQRVGVPLGSCFERMYERVPLQEVNFFAVVVSIQAQTGGNLAEALGNLSTVLRGRARLEGKVQAFSAEAKTSAAIIGALPLAVMMIVYLTTPDYIALLWSEPLGKFMLACSAVWMFAGALVMRKMINFDY